MTNDTDWQFYARWTLGQVSDEEYADDLERRMQEDGEEDPITEMLIGMLRGGSDGKERFFNKTPNKDGV